MQFIFKHHALLCNSSFVSFYFLLFHLLGIGIQSPYPDSNILAGKSCMYLSLSTITDTQRILNGYMFIQLTNIY